MSKIIWILRSKWPRFCWKGNPWGVWKPKGVKPVHRHLKHRKTKNHLRDCYYIEVHKSKYKYVYAPYNLVLQYDHGVAKWKLANVWKSFQEIPTLCVITFYSPSKFFVSRLHISLSYEMPPWSCVAWRCILNRADDSTGEHTPILNTNDQSLCFVHYKSPD